MVMWGGEGQCPSGNCVGSVGRDWGGGSLEGVPAPPPSRCGAVARLLPTCPPRPLLLRDKSLDPVLGDVI